MAPKITNLSGVQVNDNYIRINFTCIPEEGYTIEGYRIYANDIPPVFPLTSVGTGHLNNLGFIDYEILININTKSVTWWETFEEYNTGNVNEMNGGGIFWGGPWKKVSDEVVENFENYPIGNIEAYEMNDESEMWGSAWRSYSIP